ncbi:MAG: peptidylprolyl isomerase [Aeromicrobium sp.]|nr:peptidylprolyl isomerase [Aeromicrobium sp.]
MHASAPGAPAQSVLPTPAPEEAPMLHTSEVEITGAEKAVMTTSKGVIVLEFFADDAPNTVANFIELAESGFYDGLKFHRVIPGFMAQGGDPLTRDLTPEQVIAGAPGVGTGDPGWKQKAEFNSRKHVRGALSMARSQAPDSAGSQFFICFDAHPHLDGQYTAFGQVVSGMEVVDTITIGDVIQSIAIER